MIDNLKGQEELEVEKIKVTEAEIVVRGTIDKPYYVIVYHEVGKDYDNEGFGSYCLENVFKWREEDLEIMDENEQPKTDWIPCEERLPSENGLYLATFECEDEIVVDIMFMIGKQFYYPEDAIGNFGRSVEIIAWQPLPQPYKKEGAEND